MKFAFDTFVDYKEINKYTSNSSVKFTLKDVYQDLNYIEYNLEVLNNSDENVSVDFTTVNNVYILLEDNTKVYIQNPYTTPVFENLTPNDVGARNLVFSIDITKQKDIESLNIENVIINGKKIKLNSNFITILFLLLQV